MKKKRYLVKPARTKIVNSLNKSTKRKKPKKKGGTKPSGNGGGTEEYGPDDALFSVNYFA